MKSKDLEELEYLAKQFIVGYQPMTDKQKEILENIGAMELQLSATTRKKHRIERVIDALYKALSDDRTRQILKPTEE